MSIRAWTRRLERREGAGVVDVNLGSTGGAGGSGLATAATAFTTGLVAAATAGPVATITTTATATTIAPALAVTSAALTLGLLGRGGGKSHVQDNVLGGGALVLLGLGGLRSAQGDEIGLVIVLLGLHTGEIGRHLADLDRAEGLAVRLGLLGAAALVFVQGEHGGLGFDGLGLHHRLIAGLLRDLGVAGDVLLSLQGLKLVVAPVGTPSATLGNLLAATGSALAIELALAGVGAALGVVVILGTVAGVVLLLTGLRVALHGGLERGLLDLLGLLGCTTENKRISVNNKLYASISN